MTTEELKALAEKLANETVHSCPEYNGVTMVRHPFCGCQVLRIAEMLQEVQRRTREEALREAAEKMLTQQLDPLNGSIRVEAFRDAEHLLVQMAEEDSER